MDERLTNFRGVIRNSSTSGDRFQSIVIGSGPGGSLTACLLAEAGHKVLLVEEGPYVRQEEVGSYSIKEMETKYRDGGLTVALGPTTVSYVEGRCVGGGSEINSGLYHRTPLEVLDRWRHEYKIDSFDDADLIPHFEACERDLRVSLMPGPAPASSLKLNEGASRLGWKSMEVPRWYRYDAPHNRAPSQGVRQSMTRTFIPRALAAGCELISDTRVSKLHRRGTRWSVGMKTRRLDGSANSYAIEADNIFVCGGATQTPALLRRSGIKKNIGNSLRLHPTVKVIARFSTPIQSNQTMVPVHQVREFAPRFAFGGSISTPAHFALSLLDHPGGVEQMTRDWRCFGAYYAMISGDGEGSVRHVPGLPSPLVHYKVSDTDLATLSDALLHLCRLLFAAGAVELYPSVVGMGPFRTVDELEQWPAVLPRRETRLMTIHMTSTCPMGENRALCATDSFGRVFDRPQLYVADASLLCTQPGVNPQGSIMAIVRRNVQAFLGQV